MILEIICLFLEIGGPFVGCLYNKIPAILESILGP